MNIVVFDLVLLVGHLVLCVLCVCNMKCASNAKYSINIPTPVQPYKFHSSAHHYSPMAPEG